MCHKTLITLGLLCGCLVWSASPAQATTIDLIDGEGDDSGWTVTSLVAAKDVLPANIEVNLTAGTVTIIVEKDFVGHDVIPAYLGGGVNFPYGSLTFLQVKPDAETVDTIIIKSESIENHTGLTWNTFKWELTTAGQFDTTASNLWDTTPWFNSLAFSDNDRTLIASGETGVAHEATFVPDGDLVFNVDLTLDSPGETVSVTIKQNVTTPEPVTMMLLAAGLPFLLKRKRKSR